MINTLLRLLRQARYVDFGNPGLLARIASGYARLLLGRRPGRCVDLLVTYACPCRCAHCSAGPNLNRPVEELGAEEWIRICDELLGHGFFHFNFSGGEPLVSEKTFALVRHLHSRHALTSINTSGLPLDEAMLTRLRDCGLRAIQVSIDHSDSARHDAFRGRPGLYAKAMAGARMARDMGFVVSINSLVTRERIAENDVLKLYEIVRGMGLIFQLEIPCLAGHFAARKDVLLSPEDRRTVLDYLRRYPIRNDHQSTYWKEGCDAGSEKVTLTPDGEVMPCSVIPITFGSLRNEPFPVIWNRMRSVPAFRCIQPRCLAGMEDEFIDSVLMPMAQARDFPMRAQDHPALRPYLEAPGGGGPAPCCATKTR